MTQQVINTGAVANDGTGESLRNAFDAVNNNFANIWTAGPVDSQVVISNNRISTTVQNLALVLAGNGVGTITVDSTVVPGIDSVYDLGTANSRFDSVYSRYFYGNGAFLSGISNGSGSATSVTFAATPPLAANIGDIWIQSDTGIQYLYFNDNTSNQWAEMEAYQSFSSGGTGNGNVDLTNVSSDIIPSTNNSYSLGNSVRQWKDLWVSNSTIYLNSLPITADGANLKVNGNTVLTTSSPLSFSNLSVTGNVSANAVYTNNYFYANGAPFPQGSNSLPGTTISLKDNVISTTTLNQNLVLSANGVGNVQTNSSIMPDATQVRDIGSASNRFNSIYAGYYYGNGSQLTGISAGNSNSIISGNSNVKIVTAGGNVTIGIGGIGNIVVVSGAGEFVTGVVSASGNIIAPYFVGNGSLLTGITTVAAANTAQTVTANAQANITSVGTLTSLSVTGTVQGGNILTSGIVSSTGNITGNYFIGNGSQLTGLAVTYGNANVVANLAALGTNPVSTTGNVTAGYFIGNGSTLTSIAGANVTGTVANATYAVTSNAATYSTQATYAGTANAVAGANVSGTVANATYATSAGSATTAGTVTTAAQGNITSVGTLTSLSATGNITAGNIIANNLGNIASINLNGNASTVLYGNGVFAEVASGSSYGNANVVANLAALGSNPVSTTGNVSGNYFIGNGSQLTGVVSSYGNANVVANLALLGSNPVSTTGNITAGYLFGNGSQLTGLAATYSNSNVTTLLAALGSNTISGTGNITTTANISGGFILGNGSQLTGITASYGNANVVANLAALGSNPISTTGNISGNYFFGNGSQLSSVATQVTGSWTLAAGTNTVSLTVPGPGTYSIWVNGNIPNGIVTYTATIVVTNTNVPVVGSSYGWYYAAGNALVLTAIPNQIVGTENNISTAVVATTTANVFTFGITNNSGSSQIVNYGYTKL